MENLKYGLISEYEFHRGASDGRVAKENTVRIWLPRLRSGNFIKQNKPRPEIQVDNEELKAIVKADPSQTASELITGCGVSDKTVNPLEANVED